MLKDIGIIGGAGPEAGVLMMNLITKISQEKYGCKRDKDFPYFALFSFPFSEMLEIDNSVAVTAELKELIQKECSKTKFWAIACNTLHCYLDPISLPNTCVNMLKETALLLQEKPIVLCSSTSRKYQIHQRYFECTYPEKAVQIEIDKLIDTLVANEPTEAIYQKFRSICKNFNQKIVLGCTEFSLLNDFFDKNENLLDPLKITAEKLCALHFGEKNGRYST